MKVVLQWSTRQKQTLARIEFSKSLRYLAFFVLDLMSLVNDDVFPSELLQRAHAHAYSFESRQAYIEFARQEVVFELLFTLLFRRNQIQNSNFWAPFLELFLPIGDD